MNIDLLGPLKNCFVRSKVQQLQKVIEATGIVLLDLNGLKKYAIAVKRDEIEKWLLTTSVDLVMPFLNSSNQLQYDKLQDFNCWSLEDLEVPDPNDVKHKIFEYIAPIAKRRGKTAFVFKLLLKSYEEAKKLESLACSSEFFFDQAEHYSKRMQYHERAINKLEALMAVQDNFIREALIAIQLADSDSEQHAKNLPNFDTELQLIEMQYQETKDFVDAYLGFKND